MRISPAQTRALQWYRARDAKAPTPTGVGSPATRVINGLLGAGLAERIPHPEVPGYSKVVLTEAGRAAALEL